MILCFNRYDEFIEFLCCSWRVVAMNEKCACSRAEVSKLASSWKGDQHPMMRMTEAKSVHTCAARSRDEEVNDGTVTSSPVVQQLAPACGLPISIRSPAHLLLLLTSIGDTEVIFRTNHTVSSPQTVDHKLTLESLASCNFCAI